MKFIKKSVYSSLASSQFHFSLYYLHSEQFVVLLELLWLFHEDSSELFEVKPAIHVNIVVLNKPFSLYFANLLYLGLLALGHVGLAAISAVRSLTIKYLVLSVRVELVLQSQELVHVLMESVCAHALLIVGEQAVHLLDFLVHFLSLGNGLHDFNKT